MKEEIIEATLKGIEKGIKDFSFSKDELEYLLSRVKRIENLIEAKMSEVSNV